MQIDPEQWKVNQTYKESNFDRGGSPEENHVRPRELEQTRKWQDASGSSTPLVLHVFQCSPRHVWCSSKNNISRQRSPKLLCRAVIMSAEADETQSAYGDGAGGPGAPTPLSALEVQDFLRSTTIAQHDNRSYRVLLAYPHGTSS